ncbi:hypothetical protein [Hyella patelloides]|uniref:hypothetical protein n=1 Tax=Hyella patelloides TaxID=1982969 RepID=UPI0011A2E219|nr:hypothetical protein [Hyella patelloides]
MKNEQRVVDKRRSSEYKELRGFIPKALTMEFKAACKKAGQNINDTLEEAVRDWIDKQERSLSSRQENVYRGNFSQTASIDDLAHDVDTVFASLPTVATAIDGTLENPEWGLKHLAKETKISVSRLKKLLSGGRPSDEEIENLAGCLIKVDGLAFDAEELTDMRIAEDLKQRQLERLKRQQKKPRS